MGLGVLDSRSVADVPGSTRYFEDPERTLVVSTEQAGLKYDRSGSRPVILIPQPSDDPNDPLNWPLWRRDLITGLFSLSAIFATALGPILAADTITISLLFGKDFTKVALLTGYFLMGSGAAAVFIVPSARVWGKRHLFILSLVILVASSAGAGTIRNKYGNLLAARILQGVGCAPWETLVNVAVGDLYHVHQRGIRMAITNLAVFGGAFFTPIVVGNITAALGWWWNFYFVAIFCAVMLPAVFLFCPETTFRRDTVREMDRAPAPNPALSSGMQGDSSDEHAHGSTADNSLGRGGEDVSEKRKPTTAGGATSIGSGETPHQNRKVTFVESLRLFNGRKTDVSYWKLLIRPFPLFLHPAILWSCLIQGTMIGWTVFIGVIVAAIFQGPPFFWTEVNAGHAYTGAFVGALVGFAVSGLLADVSVRFLTRLNGGIYEPEFRIVMAIPMTIIGCIGLYGFGITASQLSTGKYSYIVPLVFFGLQVAGMVIGAVASSLYLVDAYRYLAIEGFTCMIVFKNFFSFMLTFYAYEWIIAAGPQTTLLAISSIQVGVCLTSIPMYVFGKRLRALCYRLDIESCLT